jgi:hypothetical protein
MMRTKVLSFTTIAAAVAVVFICLSGTAQAQFTINIPNFPKIKKEPKPTPAPPQEAPPQEETRNTSNTNSSQSNNDTPAPAKANCEDDAVYGVWREDIQKTADDAKSWSPGARDYFVRDFNDNHNKYLKMALSQSYRDDEMESWKDSAIAGCLNARLDELNAVASKSILTYTPAGYTLGTPADKAALRAALTDISKAQVFQVGVKDMNWRIVSNSLGIPEGRKKLGKLWVKYPGDKYCKIVWANVWQQYAGGGTYNSSTGDFIAWEFAGCPAGK